MLDGARAPHEDRGARRRLHRIHALPPREDDRDRRAGRVRGRHRPHARRRRSRGTRPAHVARGGIGWHDAAVRIEGPAVADVAQHFRLRWHGATRELLPRPAVPDEAGDVEAQIVRTLPAGTYRAVRRGDYSILESYMAALRSAERFVYLENQFLWSPEIVVDPRRQAEEPADATTSASSSSSRRARTTARTSRAGRSPHSSMRPTRRRASSHARSTRGRGTFAIRCTCTRRSGSSTTAGSRSARRT